MIVKILARHKPSYKSLIGYILRGAKENGNKPIIFTHNIKAKAEASWEKEYLINESLRNHQRSNQTYLYHEIISFSNKEDDTLFTKEMLEDIGNKYISLRGREGIFIGAVHKDRDHTHFHFCTSGLKYRTGKAFRLSKYELQGIKIKLQDYHKEKYPEISHSFPEHAQGKAYVTDREWQLKHRDNRQSVKEQIQKTVKESFDKAKTQKEFLDFLQEKNLNHYERNGIPTGITFEDMKIRFSRLDISKEQYMAKNEGMTAEHKALAQIRNLRQNNKQPSKDLGRDDR